MFVVASASVYTTFISLVIIHSSKPIADILLKLEEASVEKKISHQELSWQQELCGCLFNFDVNMFHISPFSTPAVTCLHTIYNSCAEFNITTKLEGQNSNSSLNLLVQEKACERAYTKLYGLSCMVSLLLQPVYISVFIFC